MCHATWPELWDLLCLQTEDLVVIPSKEELLMYLCRFQPGLTDEIALGRSQELAPTQEGHPVM